MENERFSVPEVLFRPSDIGIDQAGVAETAAQSIIALWELEQPLCAANIVCTGGNSLFPGFQARLDSELRTFLRNEVTMKVDPSQHCLNLAFFKFVL